MGRRARRARRIARSAARHPVETGRRALARIHRPSNVRASTSTRGSRATIVGAPPPPALESLKLDRFCKPSAKVVILAESTNRGDVAAWLAAVAGATSYVISPEALPEWQLEAWGTRHLPNDRPYKLQWQLKRIGAVDLLVDLRPRTVKQRRTGFPAIFWHIKPQGMYVTSANLHEPQLFNHDLAGWMWHLLADDDPAGPSENSRQRELSHSTLCVQASRDLIAIEKRVKHYLKLSDRDTNRLLPQREPEIQLNVLAALPAGTLESRARVTSHESSDPIVGLDASIPYPEAYLRHYQGRISMVSHQLLYTGHTILPDSFRHHLEPDLKNLWITNVSADFARIADNHRPAHVWHGNYYHLDSVNSGHFGHLMSEMLGRLWGWPEAKELMPDLKLIFRTRWHNERVPELERRVFGAFGISPDDVVWAEEPVMLESVIATTPLWHNQLPYYVRPEIKPMVWDVIAEALIEPAAPTYDRIFVSRTPDRISRQCRNGADVEALFATHGFTVIYPEMLDLAQQAAIFAKARVIAGFGGSALFNTLFARNLETLIVLNHEAYTSRAEHLFTSFIDCEVHYFWSLPDAPRPESGWDRGQFFSPWEFDFARNGATLQKLLVSL